MAYGEVRYCTTEDGIRIAFCVDGEGPPLLACANFVESFSVAHYLPQLEAFWRKIADHHQLIRFDARGTGLSQRDVEHYSLAAFCLDIEAVVAAARLKKFAVWAPGTSGPIAIRYTATHRANVDRLLIYGSYLRPTDVLSADALRAYAILWRTNPEMAAQTFADLSNRQRHPESGEQVRRMYNESVRGTDAARLFEDSLDPAWNAEDSLPLVSARTLVMHRRDDSIFPFAAGQAIAAGIKNARFLPLQGDVHEYSLDDSAAVLDATLAFLAEGERKPRPRKAAPAASGVTTVLFTDIVGHTEMMQRLGDAKGRDVLREHERITRETLKSHGGAEVKTMGDGFMASFGSVTSAMECAIALQRAFAAHTDSMPEPLHVRVGLNAGEPIEEDGDLFGATVILASRIAAKAGAGEILVPETVRGLLSGKGFMFGDRGEFVPKGFDEGVRLWDVRWRE
jgi:class 3 adenylate cyclase